MKPENTISKLKEGGPLTIVALGDSLTQGWMVRKGYIDFLEEMLVEKYPRSNPSILNRGIPGDTAEGGLQRVRMDVIDENPDCALIQFALNDAFTGYSAERFRNNIQAIISNIREDTDAEIVLVTSVCLGNGLEDTMANRFYSQLESLALENELPLARVHEYWKERIAAGIEFRTLVQFDQVHPTTEGYRLMAEAIMKVF